jgi:hypothetical protein
MSISVVNLADGQVSPDMSINVVILADGQVALDISIRVLVDCRCYLNLFTSVIRLAHAILKLR